MGASDYAIGEYIEQTLQYLLYQISVFIFSFTVTDQFKIHHSNKLTWIKSRKFSQVKL